MRLIDRYNQCLNILAARLSIDVDKLKRILANLVFNLLSHMFFLPYLTWCMLVNYMNQNHIFSYDLMGEYYSAVGLSTLAMLAGLHIVTLLFWGLPIFIYVTIKNKLFLPWYFLVGASLGWICIMVLMAIRFYLTKDKAFPLMVLLISLIIAGYYFASVRCSFMGRSILFGVLISVSTYFTFLLGEDAAKLFGGGLRAFGIGGGAPVSVVYREQSYKIDSGELILLGPNMLYMRQNGDLMQVPMVSIKKITQLK